MANKASAADHSRTTSDDIAEAARRHADLILRASGSGLHNYSMDATRAAILSAVLDCYQEGFRKGADFVLTRKAPTHAD